MIQREIGMALLQDGYRFCKAKPKEAEVFYKYYQEGFHVVVVIDLTQGYRITAEQQRVAEEKIKSLFFHPQGHLEGFPEGFPVYHVEVLTVLIGQEVGMLRELCVKCPNMWAYIPTEGGLMIYENQPGDFWGLRSILEELPVALPVAGVSYAKADNRQTWRQIKALPIVTCFLAAVNILVFLILETIGDTTDSIFIVAHGGMYPKFVLEDGEWWRIFTSGFLHFGIEHLANNMLILCCVGSRLEKGIGHLRMLLVYLLSELGGASLSYFMMLRTGNYAVSAGASGAVFGVIGGLLWAVIVHRGRLAGLTTRGMLFMIALSLYLGFTAVGVDNWAHIGGMLTGFAAAVLLYHRKSQKC
ncbi:MAG: rhomboid family intramembrane serine protease [Clostridiales bacterium]|nr:rhomboid family intramembrane serine protease [Clostridiales bacterium]